VLNVFEGSHGPGLRKTLSDILPAQETILKRAHECCWSKLCQ